MGNPVIHEATTENPDPAELMPVEVNSAFPEGAPSALTDEEKAKIDRFMISATTLRSLKRWPKRKGYLPQVARKR